MPKPIHKCAKRRYRKKYNLMEYKTAAGFSLNS